MVSSEPTDLDLRSLVDGLRQVLRSGLPLRPDDVPDDLLALNGVIARSVAPIDRLARVDALDRLLRSQLRRFGLPELRSAAGKLFGLGAAGTTLTVRRRAAALAAEYQLDHFRKRVEPRIVQQLAWQLYQDSLQYIQRRGDGQPFEASGDTPVISEEHIEDVKDADREILISRIWSDVYGLRAETIARETARGREDEPAFREASTGALWYLARLLTQLDGFMDRYGSEILHGEAVFSADRLIRLAGWSGEVTAEQARELRYLLARSGTDQRTFSQLLGSAAQEKASTLRATRV